ncbi:hypothetical protein [Roseibium sp.]|uniref:hypothetical protein n=1 Tax=Roseibium sp. TaxID=1936156 RepID=UPI003266F08A
MAGTIANMGLSDVDAAIALVPAKPFRRIRCRRVEAKPRRFEFNAERLHETLATKNTRLRGLPALAKALSRPAGLGLSLPYPQRPGERLRPDLHASQEDQRLDRAGRSEARNQGSGESLPRIRSGGNRLISFLSCDPGYIDLAQETPQTIDARFGMSL